MTWYLLLVFVSGAGGMTSQLIPVASESSCKVKMNVFDDTKLMLQGYIGPPTRAFCIKGK
jgi:hypothetical protein